MAAPFSLADVTEVVIEPLFEFEPPEDETELINGASGGVATTVKVSKALPGSNVAVPCCKALIRHEQGQ